MIMLSGSAATANNTAAMADREPRMLLKTIRALTRPRGFESHALRSMRRTSRRSNVPIRELAVHIVARSTGTGAGPTAVTIPLTTQDP
jgi:hypothetical protein